MGELVGVMRGGGRVGMGVLGEGTRGLGEGVSRGAGDCEEAGAGCLGSGAGVKKWGAEGEGREMYKSLGLMLDNSG